MPHSCSGLEGALVLPDSLTNVGCTAFHNCVGLTSLVFPDTMTRLSEDVFGNCRGLTGTLTLPDNLTIIGPGAFSGFVFMATIL